MKKIVRASQVVVQLPVGRRCVFVMTGILGLAAVGAAAVKATEPSPANMLASGDFSNPQSWQLHGDRQRYEFHRHGRRAGGCLEYHESGQPASGASTHVDQIVSLSPQTQYMASVWVRGDGTLRPMLRIASENWQTLALVSGEPATTWQRIEMAFFSGKERRVRFQLFGRQRDDTGVRPTGRATFADADLHQATTTELTALRKCRIEVAVDSAPRQVDPLFFGVNTLFWIDDPAAIQDGVIVRRLKELPCRLMRFPGGMAAENYHWKSGTLDDPRRYPFRGGPDTLSTDVFMKLCRNVGAEPIFVVNLQTSYLQGRLEKGIREASDWVHYCNREKGYHVRYWEIGNEQYLLTHMGARQYAEAFVRFARAMKQVDPTILIGAVGPERVDRAGAADRIPAAALRQIEALAEAARTAAIKKLNQTHRSGPAWWPIVIDIAGTDMDLAVIHEYFTVQPFAPLEMDQHVARLRTILDAKQPGHKIRIALTEWNVSKREELSGMQVALAQAEGALRFISGGVDMATFWPLRFPGNEWGGLSLLDLKTNAPLPGYQLLKLLATRLPNRTLLKSTTSRPEVYPFAVRSSDSGEITLALLHRAGEPQSLEATLLVPGLPEAKAHAVTAVAGDGAGNVVLREHDLERLQRGWLCPLPPQSLTLIRLVP